MWKRGTTLLTPSTKKWSKEKIDDNNFNEGLCIYSDFSEKDQGQSRKRVCTLDYMHPDFEKNRALIEAAPKLLEELMNLLMRDEIKNVLNQEDGVRIGFLIKKILG